jgi:hypothetical protein
MQPNCGWRILLTWRIRAAAIVPIRPYGQRPCGFFLCGAAGKMNAPLAGGHGDDKRFAGWAESIFRGFF